MEIVKEGGGHQTHSLRLKAPNNFIYSMRSVNKDPEPLIPDVARDLGLENVIVDGISAQHPYGAILAASLSKKAGVLHTHPQLVYTPRQPALGKFSNDYGDKLYLLEFETEGETNWTKYNNVVEIMDTDNLQELKMEEGDKVSIDETSFCKGTAFRSVHWRLGPARETMGLGGTEKTVTAIKPLPWRATVTMHFLELTV